MVKSPENYLSEVVDKDTFVHFLNILRDDLKLSEEHEARTTSPPFGPNAFGWENITLYDYLEACAAYTGDAQFSAPHRTTWKTLAQIMLAGKHYE